MSWPFASGLFSLKEVDSGTNPLRILWEILAAAAGGAATALMSGGVPAIGAAPNVLGHTARSITPWIREHNAIIFRLGAFDLARRVQLATCDVELRAFQRLLGDEENRKLGSPKWLCLLSADLCCLYEFCLCRIAKCSLLGRHRSSGCFPPAG